MKLLTTCICNVVGICSLISVIAVIGEEVCSHSCLKSPANMTNLACYENDEACTELLLSCNVTTWECLFGCQEGYFRERCQFICSTNCSSCTVERCNGNCYDTCNNVTCPQTEVCVDGCLEGFYGLNCSLPCPEHCFNRTCHRINGSCSLGCEGEFFGETCDLFCSPNCKYGTMHICNKTTLKCLHGCNTNYEGDKCDICIRGQTGPRCNLACEYNCQICTWDPVTLETDCALCRPGYYPVYKRCESCSPGCERNVSSDNPICDPTNGLCTFGCKNGWFKGSCNTQCQMFCFNKTCDRSTGCCTEGCTNSHHGGCQCIDPCNSHCENYQCFQNKSCMIGCKLDYWGFDCSRACSSSCAAATDTTTSVCDRDGRCMFGCRKSHWGPTCSSSCPATCLETDCDATTGHCVQGCERGYWKELCGTNCSTDCPNSDCYHINGTCIRDCFVGRYGLFCNYTCPVNCLNDTCIKEIGTCALGCRKGFTGYTCSVIGGFEEGRMQSPTLKEILDPIFYTFAALVFIGMTLVVFGINRKRLKRCKTKRREEYKEVYVNLDATSTDHNNSSHSKGHHTNRIQGDKNIYEKIRKEDSADKNPYAEVLNKTKSRRSSGGGNEVNTYEMIYEEDVTNKDEYGDLRARVSVIEVKDDNTLYQRIRTKSETTGHKNETYTSTVEETALPVEVSDISCNFYEKLDKPLASEHIYDRMKADGVSGLIKEIGGDISYQNVPL